MLGEEEKIYNKIALINEFRKNENNGFLVCDYVGGVGETERCVINYLIWICTSGESLASACNECALYIYIFYLLVFKVYKITFLLTARSFFPKVV